GAVTGRWIGPVLRPDAQVVPVPEIVGAAGQGQELQRVGGGQGGGGRGGGGDELAFRGGQGGLVNAVGGEDAAAHRRHGHGHEQRRRLAEQGRFGGHGRVELWCRSGFPA